MDLEDLSEDGNEDGGVWFRGCRCGDERGFLVTEEDLERGVDAENEGKGTTGRGEVVVGCRGCSLWVRVVFAVQDDDEEGEGGREMG